MSNLFGWRFKSSDLIPDFFKSRFGKAKSLTCSTVNWKVFGGMTYLAKCFACVGFLLSCFTFIAFKLLKLRVGTSHIASNFKEGNIA